VPSEVAASVLIASHRMLNNSSSLFNWSEIMPKLFSSSDPPSPPKNLPGLHSTNYTEEGLRTCLKCLFTLNTSIQSSQLKAVVRKYKRSRHFEVARLAAAYLKDQQNTAGTKSAQETKE